MVASKIHTIYKVNLRSVIIFAWDLAAVHILLGIHDGEVSARRPQSCL